MSFVERIKLTDGTEVASVDANNRLEVAEPNTAAIKTAVEIIDNAISGNEMQVDVVAPLPAGTNNIGDVDVLSVPAPLNLTGGGTETGALRVTIANNSTGVLSVDDNGTSLTVDGTVAATQSGTWNITNVSGTVSLPTGAATAANQSTIITAVQLLDDVVATDGSAALTKLYQVGGTDGTNAQILSTNASGHLNIADGGNIITVDGTVSITANSSVNLSQVGGSNTVSGGVNGSLGVGGNVSHSVADSGNPLKIGARAIAHGTNPTQVADGARTNLYANRHGILWTIGGHPNTITTTTYISDATGAQTGASIVGTISSSVRVVVTAVTVTVDSAVTAAGGVAVKLAFSTTTTLPADSSSGANGIILDHKGIAAGSGITIGNGGGVIAIGGNDEELRLTCEDPVGGGLSVTVTYYTIES